MSEIQRFRKKPSVTEVIRWDGSEGTRKLIEEHAGIRSLGDIRDDGALKIWVHKSVTWMWLPHGDWAALEADGSGVYPLADDVRQSSYEAADAPTVPVESAFLRQVLTDAIRACEADVMADGEAMQGLLAEYRAELAGLPAEGPAERAVSKPERRVAAPAAGEAPERPASAQGRRGWVQ